MYCIVSNNECSKNKCCTCVCTHLWRFVHLCRLFVLQKRVIIISTHYFSSGYLYVHALWSTRCLQRIVYCLDRHRQTCKNCDIHGECNWKYLESFSMVSIGRWTVSLLISSFRSNEGSCIWMPQMIWINCFSDWTKLAILNKFSLRTRIHAVLFVSQ